jgi:transposase
MKLAVSKQVSYPKVVSLDHHDGNIYMYAVDIETGEVLADCNLPGSNSAVIKHLHKIHAIPGQTIVTYEAGAAGFSPYRAFTKAGYACKIIAPTSIPHRAKRHKTDRADAISNLEYYVSGLLKFVHVPSIEDEENRELLRLRYDLVYQITKLKQKILALLKRHDISYNLTKKNWTILHRRWLTTVAAPCTVRRVLDFMLGTFDALEAQLESLDKELDSVVSGNPRYAAISNLMQLIAGFGRVNAMTIAFEIQDFSRFAHPCALMNYTGLIPGKHSSGKSDPSLKITKAGNTFLRIAYVGAAKSYRDRRLVRSAAVLKKQPPPIREFIERLQDRLCNRYRHLMTNGKPSGKAKCAIARELCGFTWELATKIAPRMENSLPVAA